MFLPSHSLPLGAAALLLKLPRRTALIAKTPELRRRHDKNHAVVGSKSAKSLLLRNLTTATSSMSGQAGGLFVGKQDRFKGVTITSKDEPCQNKEEFTQRLEESLAHWTKEGVRGLWFYVHLEHSDWIPVLTDKGFDFHHAQTGSVAMVKWLPEKEPNQIPPYCHHMVGVGGMVVNDDDELLVVQEKYATVKQWKLPGGYVDPGEDLSDAAMREVKEETGVDTEFHSLIALRHAHGFNFGCSDIYVIVRLRPLSRQISQCVREISECRWMPIQDYLDHEQVHDTNKHFARKFLESRDEGVAIGMREIELKIKDFRRRQQVYGIERLGSEDKRREPKM